MGGGAGGGEEGADERADEGADEEMDAGVDEGEGVEAGVDEGAEEERPEEEWVTDEEAGEGAEDAEFRMEAAADERMEGVFLGDAMGSDSDEGAPAGGAAAGGAAAGGARDVFASDTGEDEGGPGDGPVYRNSDSDFSFSSEESDNDGDWGKTKRRRGGKTAAKAADKAADKVAAKAAAKAADKAAAKAADKAAAKAAAKAAKAAKAADKSEKKKKNDNPKGEANPEDRARWERQRAEKKKRRVAMRACGICMEEKKTLYSCGNLDHLVCMPCLKTGHNMQLSEGVVQDNAPTASVDSLRKGQFVCFMPDCNKFVDCKSGKKNKSELEAEIAALRASLWNMPTNNNNNNNNNAVAPSGDSDEVWLKALLTKLLSNACNVCGWEVSPYFDGCPAVKCTKCNSRICAVCFVVVECDKCAKRYEKKAPEWWHENEENKKHWCSQCNAKVHSHIENVHNPRKGYFIVKSKVETMRDEYYKQSTLAAISTIPLRRDKKKFYEMLPVQWQDLIKNEEAIKDLFQGE